RYDSIHKFGNEYIQTPHIDSLAENGVAFSQAYTQSPLCSPSRASFLTGRYPRTTRVTKVGNEYFPEDEVLVTKLLADEGYSCGLVGKFHLSANNMMPEKRVKNDGYDFYKWFNFTHVGQKNMMHGEMKMRIFLGYRIKAFHFTTIINKTKEKA